MPETWPSIQAKTLEGGKREVRFTIFESMTDFADTAERNANESQSSHTGDSHFAGTDSFEESANLARDGWVEILPDVEANLRHTAEAFVAAAPTMDVAGSMVDMGLFMGGEPEHMVNYIPNSGKSPVVSIITPLLYNSGVDADAIKMYGLAMVSAIESLRQQNVTVELYGVFENTGFKDRSAIDVVRFCDSRVAYVPDQVVFGVANPSMLRRLMFGVMEGWNSKDKRTWGVGSSYGKGREVIDLPSLMGLPEDTVVFNMPDYSWNSMDQDDFNKFVEDTVHGRNLEEDRG